MFTLFRVFVYVVISVGEFGALQMFFFSGSQNYNEDVKKKNPSKYAFSDSMEE